MQYTSPHFKIQTKSIKSFLNIKLKSNASLLAFFAPKKKKRRRRTQRHATERSSVVFKGNEIVIYDVF